MSSSEPSGSGSAQLTRNSAAGEHEPGTVRLMTWNVQHARSDRAVQQAAWIAAQPADVVVLAEVTATDGGRALDETLRGYGFTTSYPAIPGDYGTTRTPTRRMRPGAASGKADCRDDGDTGTATACDVWAKVVQHRSEYLETPPASCAHMEKVHQRRSPRAPRHRPHYRRVAHRVRERRHQPPAPPGNRL